MSWRVVIVEGKNKVFKKKCNANIIHLIIIIIIIIKAYNKNDIGVILWYKK